MTSKKTASILAAHGMTFSIGLGVAVAQEASIESRMTAKASFDAASKTLTLKLQGSADKVYVNTEYPGKCTFNGGASKSEVLLKDATLEDSGKAGKAKSATWKLAADKQATGECKIVACTTDACSAPFKINF